MSEYLDSSLMAKYVCICGWIYDEAKGYPSKGIAPGTKWEDVPEDFTCPDCGSPKSMFSLYSA
jgi:rubredoxin